MSGTVDTMLNNQEQLTNLRGKTDAIAGASKGFFREARSTRRQAQCEEFRTKLIFAAVGTAIFLWLFGGWIFGGGGDHAMKLHIPPSPPPPSPPAYAYGGP